MKLTTKQLKQLIKEELKSILFESSNNQNKTYSDILKLRDYFDNHYMRQEPKAWTAERKLYIELLEKGNMEEIVSLLSDNLPLFADLFSLGKFIGRLQEFFSIMLDENYDSNLHRLFKPAINKAKEIALRYTKHACLKIIGRQYPQSQISEEYELIAKIEEESEKIINSKSIKDTIQILIDLTNKIPPVSYGGPLAHKRLPFAFKEDDFGDSEPIQLYNESTKQINPEYEKIISIYYLYGVTLNFEWHEYDYHMGKGYDLSEEVLENLPDENRWGDWDNFLGAFSLIPRDI